MKFTPEVIAALQTLRDNAENDFERHRLDVLEHDLTAPPVVEIIDDKHQRFNGVTFNTGTSGHFHKDIQLHRAVFAYYNGEIPAEMHIHHIDHNKANNDIANLKLLTREEHRRIHYYDGFPETYTCKNCGKKFVSIIKLGVIAFCSDDCKSFWRNNRKYRRICTMCGKEFRTGHSKQMYCSYTCAVKARPLKEKICPTCGKKFSTQNRRKIYCSASCRSIMYQQNNPEKLTIYEKVCPICGNVFINRNTKVECCSHSCGYKLRESRKPKNEKICPFCGKTFIAKKAKQVYCSRSCSAKIRQQNKS